MANFDRPIICDLTCRDGEVLSSSVFKVEYITGIKWSFDYPYESDAQDRVVLAGGKDVQTLVDRSIHGRTGFQDYSDDPLDAGKSRLLLKTKSMELCRTRVIVYVSGERRDVESF